MATFLWVTTTLLLLHASHSYILLTANMDDVHAIAKQLLASPVADQFSRIWRRAASQFNQRVKEPRMQKKRINEDFNLYKDAGSRDFLPGSGYLSDTFRQRGRRVLGDLSELSKNASVYLQSLRRAFNDIVAE